MIGTHLSLNSDFQKELQRLIQEAVKNCLMDEKQSTVEPELFRPKQVQQIINCSRSHLDYLSETDPTFPKKIVLSNRWTGYRKKDILAWIEAKSKGVV
jgi:predicted DNA-binding transcriptional regulator AlpA